jgi:hypothetical protein
LILKPALLILKCSLTPDTSGLPELLTITVKPRLHVRLVAGGKVSMTSPPIIVHIISLLLKQRIFLKYYINNKYKQLNIRTMAESFEEAKK